MDFEGKLCKKLRTKYGVSIEQFRNCACEELKCYKKCLELDDETLSVEEQEQYLSEILKGKTISDIIKEIPKLEDIITNHYIDKMCEMKENEVKKRIKDEGL